MPVNVYTVKEIRERNLRKFAKNNLTQAVDYGIYKK